jgi:hypothetical protein
LFSANAVTYAIRILARRFSVGDRASKSTGHRFTRVSLSHAGAAILVTRCSISRTSSRLVTVTSLRVSMRTNRLPPSTFLMNS